MNLERLLRKNIIDLKAYSSARDEFKEISKGSVFIDANENPFNNGLNRYPDPQQNKVKKRLSEIKNVDVNQILLGNGSDEVLDLIFRAFCEPKEDNIVTLPPTYGMYSVLANLNNIENKEVVLDSDFQPNIDAILKAQNSHSKLLFICSPNNPTANSFKSDLVADLIINFNGVVIIDEAYIDFSDQESWLSRINEFPNLIITQTLSKAYGMAGIRLGICYASTDIIAILNKIKPPYNVNQLTQDKALERLFEIDKVNVEVDILLKERQKLMTELSSISFIEKVYPSDANFILAKIDDANERYEQLVKNDIVVRNRTNQPLCHNCLRFTVGTPDENQRLITTLKQLR